MLRLMDEILHHSPFKSPMAKAPATSQRLLKSFWGANGLRSFCEVCVGGGGAFPLKKVVPDIVHQML